MKFLRYATAWLLLLSSAVQAQVSNPGVIGPNSAINGHAAVFSGTSGKFIVDGGVAGTVTSVTCGNGLSGATITASGTCAVIYGTGSNTAAQGNDARIPSAFASGTWTPADSSGAGLSFTSVKTNYTQVGNLVTAYMSLTYPSTANGSNAALSGLPVAAGSTNFNGSLSYCAGVLASGVLVGFFVNSGTSNGFFARMDNVGTVTNAQMSGATIRCTIIYSAL